MAVNLRSLFQLIFGRPRPEPAGMTYLKLLAGQSATFTPFSGSAYDSDVVRAAVDAVARNAARLRPMHIRRVGGEIQHVRSNLERLLAFRPNPLMDAYSFYYKVVTQLYLEHNAFIWPDWRDGQVHALWPICSSVDVLEDRGGTGLYARFRFLSGEQKVVPYESLIHLRRFYHRHDIFGDNSDRALRQMLELVTTSDQGIINAVKSSGLLRGILKFMNILKPEDRKRERDQFVQDYLSVASEGGVAAIDQKMEYIPLNTQPQMVNPGQMKLIRDKVYQYFGVNEAIVQSTYTEDEWNAFYESVIEPLALQMSLEFTAKLFTPREIGHGNEIVFEANRLQHASMRSKLALVQMVDRGALTPNEWRATMNLGPIEGGDKPIRRLDTQEVGALPSSDEGGDEDADDDPDAERQAG